MSGKEGANASKAKTASSGGNLAQARASHKTANIQPEKRPNTEMENSSFGDELTMITKSLEQLSDDVKQTKEKVKDMLSKDELCDFITKTVDTFVKQLEKRLEKEIEKKVNERTADITGRLDLITFENVELKDRIDKMDKDMKDYEERLGNSDSLAKIAMQRSNENEQYSRKNNIKIMGIPEQDSETVESLTDHVCQLLQVKADVELDPSKIDAIHRIPGKANFPKPVLMKLRNNHEKTKIMRKRKEMKEAGFRLVDDVTRLNTGLISRLSLHEHIDTAWFFNGSVYGKTTAGRRHKFEVYSTIDEVIRIKPAEPAGGSR